MLLQADAMVKKLCAKASAEELGAKSTPATPGPGTALCNRCANEIEESA